MQYFYIYNLLYGRAGSNKNSNKTSVTVLTTVQVGTKNID